MIMQPDKDILKSELINRCRCSSLSTTVSRVPRRIKRRLLLVTEKLEMPYKVVPNRVKTMEKICPGLTNRGLLKSTFSKTKVTMGRTFRMMFT